MHLAQGSGLSDTRQQLLQLLNLIFCRLKLASEDLVLLLELALSTGRGLFAGFVCRFTCFTWYRLVRALALTLLCYPISY